MNSQRKSDDKETKQYNDMAPPAIINNNDGIQQPINLVDNNINNFNNEESNNIIMNFECISRPGNNINQQNNQQINQQNYQQNNPQNNPKVIINSSNPVGNQNILSKVNKSRRICFCIISFLILISIILPIILHITKASYIPDSFKFQTATVDSNQGSIISLNNLIVQCEANQTLSGFNMIQPTDTTLAYRYNCTSVISTSSKIKYTPWNGMQVGVDFLLSSTNFLDRHNVDCGDDSVISEFVLIVNSTDRIMRYVYACLKINLNNCQPGETIKSIGFSNKDPYARSYYLSKLSIQLSDNQVLQRFQLKANYNSQRLPTYHYEYRYCSIQ